MSPAQQLTIKQALLQSKKAANQGNVAVARQLYQVVLQHRPPICPEEVSPDQINALILYHSGQMTKAKLACRELLQTYSQSL